MTGRLPWARILAEGLVIVASILLAFGIDAWWDRTLERREELGYLAALHSEFEEAAKELARDEATRAERIRVIDHLIWQMKADAGASQDSLTAWLAGLWYDSPFLPPDAVYRDLLATGGLNTLTSEELRRSILECGQFREKLRFFELREQAVWDGELRPYLEQTVDVLLVTGGAASLPGQPRLDLGPSVFSAGLESALGDRRFQNLLLARRSFTLDAIRRAGELSRVIQDTLKLIEGQLDGHGQS